MKERAESKYTSYNQLHQLTYEQTKQISARSIRNFMRQGSIEYVKEWRI